MRWAKLGYGNGMSLAAELRALGWPERLVLLALCVWTGLWIEPRLHHLFSDGWIEWDARAMGLAAWRFHGSGLFPRDLGAELAAAMCPPGWKLLYWIGTLVTDPYQVSRLLPFALVAFTAWQVLAVVRRRAGIVVAAVTLFLVLRCPFVWDRIAGANPRGFGLPLMFAFLRYTIEKRERASAITLFAQAAFYPSVLLVCAPAFAILSLYDAWRRRTFAPLGLLALCGGACLALVAPTALLVDPRIGPPITMAQLQQLEQRAIWSLYPLPPHPWVFTRAYYLALGDDVPAPLAPLPIAHVLDGVLAWFCLLGFAVALWRRRVPLPVLVTAGCSVAAYFIACAVAYRLYVPDRLLHYASVPILLTWFAPLSYELFAGRTRRPALLTALVLVSATAVASGTGLGPVHELRDFMPRGDRSIEFLAKLPRDVLIAAHPSRSSDIEVFARRSVLFSGISNAPNFATYGVTVERRIADFYDAYYGADRATVRAFAQRHHVDYLVVDMRDFGPKARERASYVEPWTTRARRLLDRGPPASLVLAVPPPEAVVFADGPIRVLDAHKL